jgi:short-subunit dehydrogenase
MSGVVLITGASEGIGRASAFAFAKRGYRLALASRQEETLRQTALDLEQQLNAEVFILPTDVTLPDQVTHLVTQVLERYGNLDILLNNAGICMSGPFVETTLDHWQQVLAVNLWGYIHTIQAVLPHFLAKKKGQIINVGSFGGKMPLPEMSAYCASKYAVTGLTESLRLELRPQGIEVIGIHPGVVRSSFLNRAVFVGDTPKESRARIEESLEGWLSSSCEEVAEAILDASIHHKTDVVVGMAQWATQAYHVFPDLLTMVLQNAAKQGILSMTG